MSRHEGRFGDYAPVIERGSIPLGRRVTGVGMPNLSDMTSSGPVVLVDEGVLRDIADALDGSWTPDTVADLKRRSELLAAARLRLYADRDRSGWLLVTTRGAREGLLANTDNTWSVGFVGAVDDFDDAPASADLEALESMFVSEGVTGLSAHLLACAYLSEYVRIVVTNDERPYHRSRPGDLPDHLQFMSAGEAVEKLMIAPGEKPPVPPPGFEDAEGDAAWWVP